MAPDAGERPVKLLLTSGGVTNPSIERALVDLLGKPIAESTALCIPTAQWGHPACGPVSARGFVTGETVWVGVSAGSMVMTPRIGSTFIQWTSPDADRTLGIVDVHLFPHLDAFPTNTLEAAERWADEVGGPAYAIDEQTALRVVDGEVTVISEGRWVRLPVAR